jgi:mannose-6-phosphate isomerase
VWLDSGHALPLLCKFIFTEDRLSIQVHPPGPRGKTEMWYILRAEPGASIALGFRETISRDRLREAASSGEIERLLNWVPVRSGDTLLIAAGTVHAIGGGLALCEIQQNNDVTYRLYDYARDRELHLEQALEVTDLGPAKARVDGPVVDCEYFRTERLMGGAAFDYSPSGDSDILIVLEGEARIGKECLRAGEAWLFDGGSVRVETPALGLLTRAKTKSDSIVAHH